LASSRHGASTRIIVGRAIFLQKNCPTCFLSVLVVAPPCHPWLSPLVVTLTGEPKMGKILSCRASLRGPQEMSRPGPFQPVSGDPVNRRCSLTIEPGPHRSVGLSPPGPERFSMDGAKSCSARTGAYIGREPSLHIALAGWQVRSRARPGDRARREKIPAPPETVNFRAQS
jgi:hypothetical protein